MNIQKIIAEELKLFLEGKAEDLVSKFPELQPAYDAGIKNPQYLQWIQKRRGGEPVEDIIGVVQAFDSVKQRLKAKGMSPDIYAYKTPAVLRQALEDLGGSKGAETRRLKDEETTYLGTFGEWIVAMPHTRESSCQLGKGTTWCTAATQSQNLFLSYVGRKKENIILYYIMKKGGDPRQDPTAKLSVGFVNGKPVLDGQDGHVSVDAQNKGLDQRRLSQILGDQFEPIMAAMEENTSSIAGKHPAKKQIEQIAKSKDPSVIDKYTQGMGRRERGDFLKLILGADPSPQVLAKLSDDEDYIRYEVAKNPSTPRPSLDKLSGDDFSDIRLEVAKNSSTRPETLVKLFGDEDPYVRREVAQNPSTPPEALVKLSPGHEGRKVRRIVAAKPSTPPELLDELSGDEDIDVRYAVAQNPSTPLEILVKLSGDKDLGIRLGVAENPSTPLEILVKLSGDEDNYVRSEVARNPTFKAYKSKQGIAEASTYSEGKTMQFTEEYIRQVIKEEYQAVLVEKKKKKAGTESSKESSLRDWFKRKGGKGSSSGWVDCNTCRKDKKTGRKKCSSCGRKSGEKRSKYPSCRPTPGACEESGRGKSWGKKSAKGQGIMNIQEIIAEELKLFLEGKAEDLVSKFPELQPAYDAGIKNPQYLQWIQKRRAGEPVEDIVGVVQAFDAAKQRLKAKGMSPDIYAYKTPAVLRQALEDLGGSKGAETRRLKDEETTYLGTFGEWIVAMPHTRESSCQLGKGTTWCTAATQSQNLFLSYIGSKGDNVVLYYIMKKGDDPRQDPTAKLSVGFVNGEPVLDGRDGHVSVDAKNKGLDQSRLSQILGDQFEPIMTAMEENTSSIEGKHPARKQIEQIAKSKDPSVIDKYTQGMEEEERVDFIKLILDADPSPQVLAKLSNDESASIREYVASNPSTPPEVLAKLSDDKYEYVRRYVANNPSTPPEVLAKLSNDKDEYVRQVVAMNTSTPPEALAKLSGDESYYVRQRVANNPSTPPEVLAKLSGDKAYVRRYVANNPSTPPEVLAKLSNDKDEYVRQVVASNPTFKAYKSKQGIAEASTYSEGKTMQFTEEYIRQVIKEEYEALLDEKKKPCKPAKGKRFAKRVDGKCRSFGQAGQAKGGGDRIRPGTKKGDAYCARSAKIKKCKNPPCANDLSRKKWKCRGSKSMK